MLDTFVLVVDDNPETLHLLAGALEADGIRVRTAASVFRALEGLHDGSPRPALIVTDLVMPQTTGWDFLRHLRTDPALKTMPVIVITGADPGESTTLAEVVLEKPVDPDQVVQTVRQLLSRPQQK
jgi:CheY-like chemotaxis protein